MLRFIILSLFCIVFLFHPAKAQYINTDSLVIVEGFTLPLLIAELDSLERFSPEVLPDYFSPGTMSSGYLLSLFSLPGNGKVISRFGPRSGRMHTGTDIKMNRGDTIYAAFDGQVTRAKYYYGYGNMVVLDHGNHLETCYAHLTKCLVRPGESVSLGEPVGLAGATGRATTSHLHFEIREHDRPYDPELVFDFENGKVRKVVEKMDNLAELHKELKPKGYSVHQPVPEKHIVRNGDSLWKISRRYRTSINTLCRLNNLTEGSVLQIGQVLKLF
jgi:murein DD-endopeptidase MepM/ murein hydrolase activator NlpD